MLSSISWQHYLAAVIVLTVSYYLYVVSRYYRAEITQLFNGRPKSSDIFPGVETARIEVMGAAKLENGITISETGQLHFSEPIPDELPDPAVNASEPSKELMIEAGSLIDAFKDIDNKQEFLNLLKILISSYKRFREEIDIPSAFAQLLELANAKLKFPVTMEDLQTNWV